MNDDKILIKASGAIAIENLPTAIQRKLWNALLGNLTQERLESEEAEFTINVKELQKAALGEGVERSVAEIEADLKALVETSVRWNVLKKDKRDWGGASALLAGYRIHYPTGEVFYNFAVDIRRLLVVGGVEGIIAPYAQIPLATQRQLNSKHNLALFELFNDYYDERRESSETRWIKLDEFQILMGTNYADWMNIKKRVIDNPLAEIRENNSLVFDVAYEVKKGFKGRVIAIKFIFTKRKKSRLKPKSGTEGNINFDALFAAFSPDDQAKIMAKAAGANGLEFTRKLMEENPEKHEKAYRLALLGERNRIIENHLKREEYLRKKTEKLKSN